MVLSVCHRKQGSYEIAQNERLISVSLIPGHLQSRKCKSPTAMSRAISISVSIIVAQAKLSARFVCGRISANSTPAWDRRSATDCRERGHVRVERRKGEDRLSRVEIDHCGLATAFLS